MDAGPAPLLRGAAVTLWYTKRLLPILLLLLCDQAGCSMHMSVGGDFSGKFGGSSVNHFLEFKLSDGFDIESFPSTEGFTNPASVRRTSPVATVRAATWCGPRLYLGGDFLVLLSSSAQPLFASSLVSRSTSGEWTAVGSTTQWDGTVRALSCGTGDEYLYFAGNFTLAMGVYSNNIGRMRIDNGTVEALGDGLDGTVMSLSVTSTHIYAAGSFAKAAGVVANHIAVYSLVSRTWAAIGAGFDDDVHTVLYSNGYVYAGGRFRRLGTNGMNVLHVAGIQVDESGGPAGGTASWFSLCRGLSDTVHALVVMGNGNVTAVGEFLHSQDGAGVGYVATCSDVTNSGGGQWAGLCDGARGLGGASGSVEVYDVAVVQNTIYAVGKFNYSGRAINVGWCTPTGADDGWSGLEEVVGDGLAARTVAVLHSAPRSESDGDTLRKLEELSTDLRFIIGVIVGGGGVMVFVFTPIMCGKIYCDSRGRGRKRRRPLAYSEDDFGNPYAFNSNKPASPLLSPRKSVQLNPIFNVEAQSPFRFEQAEPLS